MQDNNYYYYVPPVEGTAAAHSSGTISTPPKGHKNDDGKPAFSLIPGHVLADVARVFSDGAANSHYGPDNWRKGIEMRRLLSAAMRHVYEFNDGQDMDPDSGRCHLAHAIVMLMFAIETWKLRPDMDDRWEGIPAPMVLEAFRGN